MDIIRVTPDKEKVKSILKMAETTLKMIETIDAKTFPSNIVKEYYDVLRELASAVMLLEGFKTQGEGAHKNIIEYLQRNNKINGYEFSFLDDLRITRNRIAYDGFFVAEDYLERKRKDIVAISEKLKILIEKEIGGNK